VDHNGNHYTVMQKQYAQNLSTSAAEPTGLLHVYEYMKPC
ncbi:hypothetical protein CMV_025829, partial [Castanea mollissima]